jgi:hypothetical protein
VDEELQNPNAYTVAGLMYDKYQNGTLGHGNDQCNIY